MPGAHPWDVRLGRGFGSKLGSTGTPACLQGQGQEEAGPDWAGTEVGVPARSHHAHLFTALPGPPSCHPLRSCTRDGPSQLAVRDPLYKLAI